MRGTKKHSRIPHKNNEQTTRQPGHQHIEASTIFQGIPNTPDAIHNTQALSRKGCRVPRGRSAGLHTADMLTRHQGCPKRRKFRYLLRTRNSQQRNFETTRLVSRSLETDDLWPTYKRNASQTRHPRQRHRCGRLSRLYPWPASKSVCSPPTAAAEWPFGVCESILSSLLKNQKATPVHENPRTV